MQLGKHGGRDERGGDADARALQLRIDVQQVGGVQPPAAVHVARKLAAELDEGVVVTILADGGWKYISADFWETDDVETSMERTLWW